MEAIEDITHEQYLEISKMLPSKMTFPDIKIYAKKISDKFSLPTIDSTGCVFIGIEIKKGISVQDHESYKARRIKDVIRERDKQKFTNVWCSNCGKDFGPGDHGFSHCDSHNGLRAI